MCNGILFSNKRTQYAICRAMNGPRDCHTDGSMSGREKQILYAAAAKSLLCV